MKKNLVTGRLYNLDLVEPLGERGVDLKSMFLEAISGFNTAIAISDVYTTFHNFAQANDVDIPVSRFYTFIDLNGVAVPILEDYIGSFNELLEFNLKLKVVDKNGSTNVSIKEALTKLGLRTTTIVDEIEDSLTITIYEASGLTMPKVRGLFNSLNIKFEVLS
jgi:hypothetical protein